MTYTIIGWYEGDLYVARVRTLTSDLDDHPEMIGVYTRVMRDEFIPTETGLDANPDSLTRRDLDGDESVPGEEWPYSYLQMTT